MDGSMGRAYFKKPGKGSTGQRYFNFWQRIRQLSRIQCISSNDSLAGDPRWILGWDGEASFYCLAVKGIVGAEGNYSTVRGGVMHSASP